MYLQNKREWMQQAECSTVACVAAPLLSAHANEQKGMERVCRQKGEKTGQPPEQQQVKNAGAHPLTAMAGR
jgi:hypothetical protein